MGKQGAGHGSRSGVAKRLLLLLVVVVASAALLRTGVGHSIKLKLLGRATVADRVAAYGERARARMAPHFAAAGIAYPPERFSIAAFKQEEKLEVYAVDREGTWKRVLTYPILKASGKLGPKLREGDGQVPEGLYQIESLNPNSLFHLSLRVSYPNAFDREKGAEDGRTDLGGDIMIHGDRVSIGCLAMGDPVSEELFVLAADVGWVGVPIVISPVDFRVTDLPADSTPPLAWIEELYEQVRAAVLALPQ